jgi:methylglutaconyl-CoA hydratase
MFQTLELKQQGYVATVSLNRPLLRNAFNEEMIAEITQAFEQLGKDETIRVIVLAAHGKAFCAGADLNWMKKMADYSQAENLHDAAQLANMLLTIYSCAKPVIAKIQGDCYAGGMGLAAACDIVVAHEDVHFCLSEVKLGLIPATISPYVIKAMGESAARRYFLTAERFTAARAAQLGFVSEVTSAEQLDAKVDELVAALVANSPHAVSKAKSLVADVAGSEITDDLIASTVADIADIRASEQGREGVQAFLEKRKPFWLEN